MKERILSLALLAAVSIGIAPAFAQVSTDAGIANNDNLIADCMIPQKRSCRRVYKKCTKRTAKKCIKRVAKPAPKVTQTTTQQTVEKPAVLPQPEAQPVQQTVEQPAVVSNTPVIIDRFEKRHRSLIHLGLFPFSLFGQ